MVHAISAITLVVVALNAASTMAYPFVLGGDALETRSESEFGNIKSAAVKAALPKGADAAAWLMPRATPATLTSTPATTVPGPTPHPDGKIDTTTREGSGHQTTGDHVQRATETRNSSTTGDGAPNAKATPSPSSGSETDASSKISSTTPAPAAADAKSPSKTTNNKFAAPSEEFLFKRHYGKIDKLD